MTRFVRRSDDAVTARRVIGVVCCNEVADRPIQAVATRFIRPLQRYADAAVLLVPAVVETLDARLLAARLDGLLLTGSRSNVAPDRYGGDYAGVGVLDTDRDLVAFDLAGRMIEAGRPVFGICRGLQELNVLFGGTLTDVGVVHHHQAPETEAYEALFDHAHDVDLQAGGALASAIGQPSISVTSVHRQGIARLGDGLAVEAISSDDGLIEAFSARPCDGLVLAVQWHPEWNIETSESGRAFFSLVGQALLESDVR